MRRYLFLLSVVVTSLAIAFPAVAADKSSQVISDIPNLSDIKLPYKDAKLLKQTELDKISQSPPTTEPQTTDNADINLEVTGEQDTQPESTPVYVIDKDENSKTRR